MAGTAIIGSLAEALNLLIFFFLSPCFHLIAFPYTFVCPPLYFCLAFALFFIFLCLCVSLPFAASPCLCRASSQPLCSISLVSLCVLALCAGLRSLVSLLES